jgi:hypothetical protein
MGAVCRIDIDQDRSELGRGELDEDPLRTVGRPDPDAVTLRYSQRLQPEGTGVDLGLELAIVPPASRHALDERRTIREPRDSQIEVRPDRVAQHRRRGCAVRVGQTGCSWASGRGVLAFRPHVPPQVVGLWRRINDSAQYGGLAVDPGMYPVG